MSLTETFRTMEKRLRLMLLSTALLLVPQIGQFITVRDLNTAGRPSDLAVLFQVVGLFLIPTSLIFTGVIMYTNRAKWREHERLMILGVLNLIIILNLAWFFIAPCMWSQVFGLALKSCHA